MAQQIAEITKVPTNTQVIKILNEIIKRYNSLGSIYTFKGSVQTYAELLAIENPNVGDVYNVVQEDEEHQIAAGSNFVWDGTVWDNLGGSLAGLVQSVNGVNPDSLGNVLLPLIKNVSIAGGNIVFTKNDDTNVNVDNVKKLYTTMLGESVDLNTLTGAGIYMCGNNDYAANYENCPVQKSFLLEVQANNNSDMIWQFLTQYNDGSTEAGNQYIRAYQVSNGWSAWRTAGSMPTEYLKSISQVGNKITITDGNDLQTIIEKILKAVQDENGNNIKDTYATIMQLNAKAPLASNAGAHNGIFRGKYLGNALTEAQSAAIQAGTFEDLYIGDYWTINDVDYVIVAFDYYYNAGDIACTTHHAVVVPRNLLYNAQMNSTNVVTGAYVGSAMYTTNLNTAKTTIQSAFGSTHLLTIRQLFQNSVAEGDYENSIGEWYDATVWLMNEFNVYGGLVWKNALAGANWRGNYTIDNSQYPGFALDPTMIHTPSRNAYWFRDVSNSNGFAGVDGYGYCSALSASNSYGVRPAFCIK